MIHPWVQDDRVVSRVDYQVCEYCGFRLMRVETTLVGGQRIVAKRCPICGHSDGRYARSAADLWFDAETQRRFDDWLVTHGLNRETLEKHYHLRIEDFFEPLRSS